jgi:hypothetical protein
MHAKHLLYPELHPQPCLFLLRSFVFGFRPYLVIQNDLKILNVITSANKVVPLYLSEMCSKIPSGWLNAIYPKLCSYTYIIHA